ncbi:stress response facilitator SrfA, partial [Pseudomonas aeruginosa]
MAEPQDKYTRRTGRTWADDQATYNRLREEADAARQKLRES